MAHMRGSCGSQVPRTHSALNAQASSASHGLPAGSRDMHPIALCAVLGAGVMIERFVFLFFRFNIDGKQPTSPATTMPRSRRGCSPSSACTRTRPP